ncbi:HEAT repeat domain-containing protein [Streptomyces griseofuscus]|uniref:HEAT repeat domain-containing protein n=1 Tax=Streptomyces griseofuscus TaxID=146922 RepID=UPI0037F91195
MTEINAPVTAALSGLDTVDWSALTHAYGPADDVPGLLGALCSPDEERRRNALYELYGNIFHQGSRYPATAAAVPFLVRMAADPQLPDRAGCLQLLAALAIGYDEAHLPGGIAITEWRSAVEEVRAQDPEAIRAEYDAWVEAASDDKERRMREFRRDMYDHDRQLEALAAELGAYDAVRAGIPALLPLLGDTDAAVRTGAAYVLAWFPEAAGESLPRLLARLDEEREPAALATALVAVGLLGDDGPAPNWRCGCGRSSSQGSRWCAGRRPPRWPGSAAGASSRPSPPTCWPHSCPAPRSRGPTRAGSRSTRATCAATPPPPSPCSGTGTRERPWTR